MTLESGRRTEAAGPFFYHEQTESGVAWGIPPLITHERNDAADVDDWNFLWRLMTRHRIGTEHRYQFLQLIQFGGGVTLDEETDRRFSVFPFYFQRRSSHPEREYTALFPLYGTIQDRLGRDEISFAAAPLYIKTRKRDVVTRNYLFPFFHLREGDELSGWQLWPLIGRETKGTTTRTNVLGEISEVGPHKKGFVGWPFFLYDQRNLGLPDESRQQALLPLYHWQRSAARDSTTVIWPLFSLVDDRARGYREWHLPYPFIVFARGEGKRTSRVWPLFGVAEQEGLKKRFILGPLHRSRWSQTELLDRERHQILYFLYDDLREKNLETGQERRRRNLFPLFTYERDREGRESLQVLALLEPFLPANESVRRSLSPLWALWRQQNNPAENKSSQSLLWNLYRRDVKDDERKVSLLFGLFRYERSAKERALRFFYLPRLRWSPDSPTTDTAKPDLEPDGRSGS